MTDRFDLERRAAELFTERDGNISSRNPRVEHLALQLARELAEAIAAECERLVRSTGDCDVRHGLLEGAEIARSFTRPRTREEVYREALERVLTFGPCEQERIAQRALDEGAKVGQ